MGPGPPRGQEVALVGSDVGDRDLSALTCSETLCLDHAGAAPGDRPPGCSLGLLQLFSCSSVSRVQMSEC